jgi:hypothetical protein
MEWDWKTKTGIAAVVLLVLALLAFVIKVQHDTIERLKYIETSVVESKQIGEDIVRAQSSYVTKKDLDRAIKDQGLDLKAIKKDLGVLGADVKGLNTITVVTPGYNGNNIPSTGTGDPNPDPPDPTEPVLDKYGYFAATQKLRLTEPFGDDKAVPFGEVGFSAWQEKPWDLEILPREYRSQTVLGQDRDGRHYAYSRFQIEVDGKTYTVPIAEAKLIEEYPSPAFSFNPRLYLGIDGGGIANPPAHAELTPSLGLSFFSYGKTKVSPDWSFLYLGLGYATQHQAPVLLLAPANYNVAKPIPFMDNFHVGPAVSVDVDGNIGLYIGGRVAF